MLKPFSFCENAVLREHLDAEGINTNYLLTYTSNLCQVVERKIVK